jgi:outer membrane receptor protein involved in Fe transport
LRTNKRPTPVFRKKGSVVATQFALMLMAAPLAFAQQTQKVEKVEVTGSRIASPNLETASPVAVIRAEDIKLEGVRNVENLLNNLPQVFADQGGNVSNGASGTATVNLRNLGADRTLVLINGRRMVAGSPNGPVAPDLNQIPAALIKRIDVLTGGASAVYGSDAVAGVVNFIMNDSFEGVQGEVNHSFFNHNQGNAVSSIVAARAATNPAQFKVPGDKTSDGESTDVNMTLGGNFANGKGNATVFLGYKEEKALLQSERDYSACALGSTSAGFVCGGSGTSYPGRFIDLTTGRNYTVADASGGVRPYVAANDQYNYGPLNYYQRPSKRYTAAAFAHYDAAPNARVYSEFMFHDDQTVAQIAPSGMFGLIVPVAYENPLLSSAWRTALGLTGPGTTNEVFIFRRNVEGGGRQDDIRHTSYRGVLGVKGDVFKHWNYDLYGQSSRVIYQEIYRNDFSFTRSGRAMDVVAGANGAPTCASVVNGTDANCVPYDIWRLGGVTEGALDYLQTPGFKKGFTSQTVIGGTMSADLGDYGMKIPGAKSGISVAFGIETRKEELQLETDNAFTTGDLFGQGGPTIGVEGQYSVRDFFMEGRVPILEGNQSLALTGSYRRSDYSTDKKTNSYGVGLEFEPVKNYRFRASYQQAVRAPNIIELFQAQGVQLFDMDNDPCGPTRAYSAAECARTGVTAAQYGSSLLDSPAGQYNFLAGGNTNLDPETAKTGTLGLVITPMKDFSASFDYFNIEVEDVISILPPTTTLTQCLQNNQFCNLIQRDRLGTLWSLPEGRVIGINVNLSKWKTSGFDFSAAYNHNLGEHGRLNVDFIGTYLKEFKQEPVPGLGEYDCAGLYGSGTCGTPLPEWRHKLRGTWSTPWKFDVALTWRYIDEVKFERTSSDPLLTGPYNQVDAKLAAQNYIDVAVSWPFTKNLTFTGGINNLTDRDPPLSAQVGAGFGNGNTYPQVYDALGMKVFLGLTAKF